MRHVLLPFLVAFALVTGHTNSAGTLEGVHTLSVEDDFDNVFFDVENAIVNRGYVIDYVAHIGEMLTRTAGDVGASREIYSNARILQFCSAVLSRRTMEANVENIAFCPYAIFVFERIDDPGIVYVGFRELPVDRDSVSNETLAAVNSLLSEIVSEVAGQ